MLATDTELRRRALLDQMDPGGGGLASRAVSGIAPGEPAPGTMGQQTPEPSPIAPAKTYALEGFDAGKMADTSYNSPKYAIGRALQTFDPRQGVTDEVLAALNASGAGQQYQRISGDKVRGADGRVIDLVRGFNDPNGTGGWQLGLEDTPGQAQGGGLNSLFTGDPLAGIQAAIGQYGGQSANLQALLRQLQQGA